MKAMLIKNNPTVKMPRARPSKEEAQVLTRRILAQATASDLISSQKEYINLTTSKKRGLWKLNKRAEGRKNCCDRNR